MIAWDNHDVGNHRIRCPACGRGARDKTLGVTIRVDGKGVAHCFRCAFTATHRPWRGSHVTTPGKPRIRAAALAPMRATLSDYGRHLWAAGKPLSGAALSYLSARRCRIPPADGDLRWHPSLLHPTRFSGPALVARVTDVLTGEPLSLHRTWIQADGRKADVDPPRLLLGGHRKQGGVIRLWPQEAVTVGLGIAEGIETALSLAWGIVPVWACIDAGNMRALPVLAGIEALTIASDDDAAGIAAAGACAQRWADAGRDVVEVAYGA